MSSCRWPRWCARRLHHKAQCGVVLVVTLVLLLVATLLGLAGIRGTNLQERMSANVYDRSLAFQRAEAALRDAERAITANGRMDDLGAQDCSASSSIICGPLPAADAVWIPVGSQYDVNGDKAPGPAQYFIQFMGSGGAQSNVTPNDNAEFTNYGSSHAPDTVAFYRVTARSSAPSVATDRAIVVLQSTVKRAL